METKLFKINYKLTLLDGSFMQTTSYVAANDEDQALSKLVAYRKTLPLEFTKLEYLSIDRQLDVIV